MRSRYSAYATKSYQYIVNTYAAKEGAGLSSEVLLQHDEACRWRKLEIVTSDHDEETVEFKAYYQTRDGYYCMHERSSFIKEMGEWRYVSGKMLEYSGKLNIGRNSLCPCASGKKFKRCCASTQF